MTVFVNRTRHVAIRDVLPVPLTAGDFTFAGLFDAYHLPAITAWVDNDRIEHTDDECSTFSDATPWRSETTAFAAECGACFGDPPSIADCSPLPETDKHGLYAALTWYYCTRGGPIWAETAGVKLTAQARGLLWYADYYHLRDHSNPGLARLWTDLCTEAETLLSDPAWQDALSEGYLWHLIRTAERHFDDFTIAGATVEEARLLADRDLLGIDAEAGYPTLARLMSDRCWVRARFTGYRQAWATPPSELSAVAVDFDPTSGALLVPRVALASLTDRCTTGIEMVDASGTLPRDVAVDACITAAYDGSTTVADLANALLAART